MNIVFAVLSDTVMSVGQEVLKQVLDAEKH